MDKDLYQDFNKLRQGIHVANQTVLPEPLRQRLRTLELALDALGEEINWRRDDPNVLRRASSKIREDLNALQAVWDKLAVEVTKTMEVKAEIRTEDAYQLRKDLRAQYENVAQFFEQEDLHLQLLREARERFLKKLHVASQLMFRDDE